MNCPFCIEVDLRECSCIKEQQDKIIDNIETITDLIENIDQIMSLNELLIESSTRAYDAKFYIGRRTGIELIKNILIKIK